MFLIKLRNIRRGASVVILIFSVFVILALAGFALDLGIILNTRYELQKAVESTALLTISQFEPYEMSNSKLRYPPNYKITANTGFANLNYDTFKNSNSFLAKEADAKVQTTFSTDTHRFSKSIKIEAEAVAPTYFINILGLSSVNIKSAAAAVNTPFYLSKNFPKPKGSVINGEGTYRDTEIKEPLGGDTSSGAVVSATVYNLNNNLDNLYGAPDFKVTSLGPGGYFTVRPPFLLYDGKGVDFSIFERGHAEGYFVFVGNDKDPDAPYFDASNPGGGIEWVNVSCTGIPVNARTDGPVGAYFADVDIGGSIKSEPKFYGSGLFDLGTQCVNSSGRVIYDGNARVVKYIKIIDDNEEDGFFLQPQVGVINPNAIPMIIPGEHSHFSPGADIDAIGIFHHARLISVNEFEKDTDNDLLIDVVEQINGYNVNGSTDGEPNNDGIEHIGFPNTAADPAADALPNLFSFRTYFGNVFSTSEETPLMVIDP